MAGSPGYGIDDCSSIVVVNSNNVTFIGCKESVSTTSLTNATYNNKNNSNVIIYSFKGIPYAEPPIGILRFQKPIAKTYTQPVYIDSTRYRSACIQPPTQDIPLPNGLTSEDCLFLNILTPTLNRSANLPVMFYIHGGGFLWGSGSVFFLIDLNFNNGYDGSLLVIRDVIFISFNYRLGAFGFLYGNRSDCPGNVGLWDQAMALNWTKQNIRAFGGNPNNITIFGQSSGSISVSNHIVSNVSRNWFQRAIMQSGSSLVKLWLRDKDYSYKVARRFASHSPLFITGSCSDTNTWIECMRNKSAKEILWAQSAAVLWNPSLPWYSAFIIEFVPMFEDFDNFMPKSVYKALKDGDFRTDINILIGHTELEGEIFAAAIDIVRFLMNRYNPKIPFFPFPGSVTKSTVYNDIKNIFINNNSFDGLVAERYTETFNDFQVFFNVNEVNRLRNTAVHAFSDYFFTCPTVLFGYYFSLSSQKNVFQYKLTYANSMSLCADSVWANVTHADDVVLVFGAPFIEFNKYNENDRIISKQFMDIWTTFAKYDKVPAVNGNEWPPYSDRNLKYLELHPNKQRLGRIFLNAYDGVNDGYESSVINDCLNFWDKILWEQF